MATTNKLSETALFLHGEATYRINQNDYITAEIFCRDLDTLGESAATEAASQLRDWMTRH
jgi:hypothetical protein